MQICAPLQLPFLPNKRQRAQVGLTLFHWFLLHQIFRQCQRMWIQREIRKAAREGGHYLPLANRAQVLLVDLAYRANSRARWAAREILRSTEAGEDILDTAATTALVAIPGLASFCLGAPLYFLASYVGIGTFERIEPTVLPSDIVPSDSLSVMFQNGALQDPYSLLTAGLPTPCEVGPDGTRRVDAIADEIVKRRPTIFCGYEFEDSEACKIVAKRLARVGYTCIWDRGNGFRIPSGLFVATLDNDAANSISFTPIAPEHRSGVTSLCNRAVLAIDFSWLRVITFHLSSGRATENQLSRKQQSELYIMPLAKNRVSLLIGDTNLPEQNKPGFPGFTNAIEGHITYVGKHGNQESIDAAFFRKSELEISGVTITPGNSDHHSIFLIASKCRRG